MNLSILLFLSGLSVVLNYNIIVKMSQQHECFIQSRDWEEL